MNNKHVLVKVREIAEQLVDIIRNGSYEQSYTYDLVLSGLAILDKQKDQLTTAYKQYKALEHKRYTKN